jgi:predicted Ser/Thr protein kinase
MADSDWVKYKQIRGKPLPEAAQLLGAGYRLGMLLKRDFYAVTGVFERADDAPDDGPPRQVLVKVYHTDPLGIIPLRSLGRFLCRRETDRLRQLDGIAGVPRLLAFYGDSGFIREFIPGCNLREYSRSAQVDADFFPSLRAILAEVHARGVSHNDLSKPENILVTPDGRPVLIDFQISTRVVSMERPLRRLLSRRLVRFMQRVDHYHLAKLHTRRRPLDFTDDQRAALNRKGIILTMHGWVRRPYRAIRHLVLRKFLTAKGDPAAAVPAPHLASRSAGQDGRPVGVAGDRRTG